MSTQRRTNPGLTAEQLGNLPLDTGNIDFTPQEIGFLPMGNIGEMRIVQINASRWEGIEAAIGVTLDTHQRSALHLICSVFVYTCVLKGELPSFNRHLSEMKKKAEELSSRLRELIAMLWVSDEDMSKPHQPHQKVTTAADHFLVLGMLEWQPNTASLRDLALKVAAETDKIEQMRTKTRGADGHYELRPLLANLMYVARSTGDDLRITSQEFRAETGSEVNKRTPLVLFVEEMLRVIRLDKNEWIQKYDLNDRRADDTRKLVEKLLNKRTGNLLKPLLEVRLEIEGKPRAKVKSTNAAN